MEGRQMQVYTQCGRTEFGAQMFGLIGREEVEDGFFLATE
jgi:hypothetical protein